MVKRFFINKEKGPFAIINEKETLKHIKVLRLKAKDPIVLFNGKCGRFSGIIEKIDKNSCLIRITKKERLRPPPIKITLIQGLCKHPKMDIVVESLSCFPIERIIPFIAKRSIQKNENIERLRNIAKSSFLTSNSPLIPVIYDCVSIERAIEMVKQDDLIIVGNEEEKMVNFKDVLTSQKQAKRISVFIGPEGGFENDEIKSIQKIGGISVSFGDYIIKTEYAGFFAISSIIYEFMLKK